MIFLHKIDSNILCLSAFGACLLSFLIGTAAVGQQATSSPPDARRWAVQELAFEAARGYDNPYLDVEVTATFSGPDGASATVPGFWDGGRTFTVRFTPTAEGRWTYTLASRPRDPGLSSRGAFEAGDRGGPDHGFLRRDASHPTSFVFDDGTRCFMWGTTYYHLLLNARAGDRWKEAVDGTIRYGMNKIRFSLSPSDSGSKSGGYPTSTPFLDDNRRRLDLDHWRAADEVIRRLNDRGVLADVILFWRKSEDKVTDAMRDQDQRYLRYALARYAAFPNVLWCMVNEWNYSSVPREYWNELGQLVRDEDPWSRDGASPRALSIHQQTRPDWNFDDQDWPSHAIVQLGVRNRGSSTRIGDEWAAAGKAGERFRHGDDWGNQSIVRNWNGRYPIVNDEYGYIGEPQDDSEPKDADGSFKVMTRDKHRRIMWGIAVGGGYASAGDKTNHGDDGSPYFSANWHDAPEYGDIRRLIDFFTRRGLEPWTMAPHNELVRSSGRAHALAEPGNQYVIYAASGGEASLELARGTYRAERFNPRDGTTEDLGRVQGGSRQTFTLPDENDWVIALRVAPGPDSPDGNGRPDPARN